MLQSTAYSAILTDDRMRTLENKLSELYDHWLTATHIDILHQHQSICSIVSEVRNVFSDYKERGTPNSVQGSLASSIFELLSGLISLVRERYTLVVETTEYQNKCIKKSRRLKNSRKSKRPPNASVMVQFDDTPRKTSSSRRYDQETKQKLENWFLCGDFSQASIEEIKKEVHLTTSQIKNWVSNRKRNLNKMVAPAIEKVIRSSGLVVASLSEDS